MLVIGILPYVLYTCSSRKIVSIFIFYIYIYIYITLLKNNYFTVTILKVTVQLQYM